MNPMNSTRTHFRTEGFTLIELMVAMMISVFLLGGIFLMQLSGRTASTEADRLSRIQENIRFTSDFLVRELRNAGFRDELSLKIDMFNVFATQGFAVVSEDGSEITIRMSGARSCGNPAAGGVLGSLVTNRYFVQNGDLMCEGSVRIPDPEEGEDDTTLFPAVALTSGIREISFETVCPNPVAGVCTCTLWGFGQSDLEEATLDDTCHSVIVRMTFEGPGGADNDMDVELRAAFRNVAIGRIQWKSIDLGDPDDA